MNFNKKLITIGSVAVVALLGMGVPSGAATKAPAKATHAAVASHVVKKVAFKGTYKGTIGLLMNGTSGSAASTVTVTSLKGTGTGTNLGASTLTGSDPTAISAGAQCAYGFSGTGMIVGTGGSKLVLKVAASPKQSACAAAESTPTSVAVKGIATVTSGTGKYKGVSGTLTFTGSFNVQSNNVPDSESDAFTATLTGTLTIKS